LVELNENLFRGSNKEEVNSITKDLAKISVRCEAKAFVVCETSSAYVLKGFLNELKEKYKDTELMPLIIEWEKYLNIARDVLKVENRVAKFKDEFLNKIFPKRILALEKLNNLLKEENIPVLDKKKFTGI
jgi:hypothetical protein